MDCATCIARRVVIFLALFSQGAACLPWHTHSGAPQQSSHHQRDQHVSAALQQSPTYAAADFASGSGGGDCSILYFNENFQVLQQNANQTFSLPANSIQPAAAVLSLPLALPDSIGLECKYITAEQLLDKFNQVKPSGLKITSLIVRDSNLTNLSNLPQGTHELRKLVISNTSIDLEVLKDGSESLDQLTSLEIINEKISNIPQNFFKEMQSLKELRLENDEIASLDSDAFHNLDDSLELLDLRKNRFNRFPMAVKNLAQLAVLDLTDNDIVIDTQENDLPEKLEPLLNLRELAMNRINCTCEFSSSPFFEWIARTHISGVRCFAPDKLKSQEVIVFERDEFCTGQSNSATSSLLLRRIANSLPLTTVLSPICLAATIVAATTPTLIGASQLIR